MVFSAVVYPRVCISSTEMRYSMVPPPSKNAAGCFYDELLYHPPPMLLASPATLSTSFCFFPTSLSTFRYEV